MSQYPPLYSTPAHSELGKWDALVKASESLLKEKELIIERWMFSQLRVIKYILAYFILLKILHSIQNIVSLLLAHCFDLFYYYTLDLMLFLLIMNLTVNQAKATYGPVGATSQRERPAGPRSPPGSWSFVWGHVCAAPTGWPKKKRTLLKTIRNVYFMAFQ